MNLIVDRLPYYVRLGNKKYKVNVDYRCMINFEKRMQDSSVSKSDKIILSLRDFYGPAFFYDIQRNGLLEESINKLVWFYKCGKKDSQIRKANGKIKGKSNIYSWDYDDQYIYGAFFHDYKKDLTKDKIHWWKFKAMLLSLDDSNQFEKIKGYRSYTGDDKNIQVLKKYHEIPVSEEEQDRINRITAMLMHKEE